MTKTIDTLQRTPRALVIALTAPVLALATLFPFQTHAALLTQQLDQGMTHPDVSSLQVFLSTFGNVYPSGLVTGYFGPLTFAGVAGFQTANNISAVGRVGPITLSAINAAMGGGNTPQPTGDVWAPTMTGITVSAGTNALSFSWATSESAHHRVMYSTTWPFLYATAPSVSATGFGSSTNITISGLQPRTTYYYVLESIDTSGNVMWTASRAASTQ